MNVGLSVVLLILIIKSNINYKDMYIRYKHEYASTEVFIQFMKQTKEYLSHDIILNCLANAMKICENKNVITVHMSDGDYMKVAEEFYKEMDGDERENECEGN